MNVQHSHTSGNEYEASLQLHFAGAGRQDGGSWNHFIIKDANTMIKMVKNGCGVSFLVTIRSGKRSFRQQITGILYIFLLKINLHATFNFIRFSTSPTTSAATPSSSLSHTNTHITLFGNRKKSFHFAGKFFFFRRIIRKENTRISHSPFIRGFSELARV